LPPDSVPEPDHDRAWYCVGTLLVMSFEAVGDD
jgi:hypothetical protein